MLRKNLSYILLALAIVVLLVIYVLATFGERRAEHIKKAELQPFFQGIKKDGINYIEFEKDEKKIKLKKEEDRWFVLLNDGRWFPVNPPDVEEALEYFTNVEPAELIAEGKEKLEKFELSDKTALKVTLAKSPEDKSSYKLFLGKAGPDFRSTYAVKPDETKIFLVAENKNSFWQRDPDEWRDKAPFRYNREDITKIAFTSANSSFILERDKDGMWQFTYPGDLKADSNIVVEFLSRISGMVAISLLDGGRKPEYKLDTPDFTIEFKVGNEDVKLIVSPETEDRKRYVENTHLNQIYALSASTWVGVPRTKEEFVLKEVPKKEKKEEKKEEKNAKTNNKKVQPETKKSGK